MRIYVAVVVVLVLVLAVSFAALDKLNSSAKDLVEDFSGLEEAIATGNWAAAGRDVEKLAKKWSGHKDWWAIVIDHQEIDNIEMSLIRIGQYIRMQDRALAAGELAVLKKMLEHIPEKEKVNLKNIL
ncbi:DUF4363 family protein [Desulfallas thermosapovorans]|uniref:Uncharacterized protein DUF4363 n=1 Tax=Desulfallas thermosapovorans DSM 6562 TaxID=1121431 RepID=A0A5S4ZTK6_9FIRM|nr:DUF4363 family protein [Desulfallas thermosapovorans]TYO96010.1 uncharacterized protein DUF4363 [Desulfallas thermosapovorans DSM 6562]